MKVLLHADDATRGLRRMAGEIIERHRGVEDLILVGIRRGGVPVAERLAALLAELEAPVPLGTVDITLYRDDAGTALPSPRIGPTRLPTDITKKRILLCDDVLYTGRTIRAALDALLDYGRPARVELAVLFDRGGRELPIQADYRVAYQEVPPSERVDVLAGDEGPNGRRLRAVSVPLGSPSTPPLLPTPPPPDVREPLRKDEP
jgi:pyrimidine operon attenuation protein/uracil phosphoribosyltransferase